MACLRDNYSTLMETIPNIWNDTMFGDLDYKRVARFVSDS